MKKPRIILEAKQLLAQSQLNGIIVELGLAMRRANRKYVSEPAHCQHDNGIRFTPSMESAWRRYQQWCRDNPEDLNG